MCSVVQDDFVADIVEPLKPVGLSSECKKCSKENAVIVLQKRHCYCRSCFLNMINHKFRSTLGKTKLMKQGEKVLVSFYGDQNSVVLLHLLEQGIAENTHKKIRFQPIILFIDENALWSNELDKCAVLQDIKKSLKSSFPCYVVKLSSVYDNCLISNLENFDEIADLNENDKKLCRSISEMKSTTSKIELIMRLRYLIQISCAEKLGCSKIFTSENTNDLSIKLMSDVILGRGSQISCDTGVIDDRNPDICWLRPLRDITAKEITFYGVFNELNFFTLPSLATTSGSSDSIQEVTESFIYELQEDFPSTIYTICNTGDKLKMSHNGDEQICGFCNNSIDLLRNSQTTIKCLDKNNDFCDNCSCEKKVEVNRLNETLLKTLCYGCHRLVSEMNSLKSVPIAVVDKLKTKLQVEEMRSKIEDFLL